MNRKFYFLKDSVTQKFYTGESYYINSFNNAAVYYQKKNVEKRLKELIKKWEWYQENWTIQGSKLGDYAKQQIKFVKENTELVNERKNLPNWGIEIVEVVVKV